MTKNLSLAAAQAVHANLPAGASAVIVALVVAAVIVAVFKVIGRVLSPRKKGGTAPYAGRSK